jgi:hypothetical protein
MVTVTQLLFQQNALVLLKAQDITICTFCLCSEDGVCCFKGNNESMCHQTLLIPLTSFFSL